MKIEIHCPFHGNQEEIEVPDYYLPFEGEVICSSEASVGTNSGPFVLHIKIAPNGRAMQVVRAPRAPGSS